MQLIKAIILSIVSALTNTFPISYSSHITLYQNLFNTNTFDNQNLTSLLNLSLIIAILLFLTKDILHYIKKSSTLKKAIKEEKTKIKKSKNVLPTPELTKQKNLYKTHTKYLKVALLSFLTISLIYLFLPKHTSNLKAIAFSFLITVLLIFLSTNKKGTNTHQTISYKTAILLSLSTFLSIIPTLSPLCIYLFILSILHFNKETALKFALINTIPILLINSIPGTLYFLNDQTYLITNLISITLCTFLSYSLLKTLKKIYLNNKLYKLSLYCLFLSIFILIWFR